MYRATPLLGAHREDPEFKYRLLADPAREVRDAVADWAACRIMSKEGGSVRSIDQGRRAPEAGLAGPRRPLHCRRRSRRAQRVFAADARRLDRGRRDRAQNRLFGHSVGVMG